MSELTGRIALCLMGAARRFGVRLCGVLICLAAIARIADAESASLTAPDFGFATVEAGRFEQGSADGEWDERPIRTVEISRPVTIGLRPVTNREYEAFRPGFRELHGAQGPRFSDDNAPVVMVNWQDATEYCDWLTKQTGIVHRLPTEAEWEYVCHRRPDIIGVPQDLPEEWCYDWYGPYTSRSARDPVGYATGDARVVRGGAYRGTAGNVAPANRLANLPADRNRLIGFRVVRGELPSTSPLERRTLYRWAQDVSQQPYDWSPPVDMSQPYFAEPLPYVHISEKLRGGPLFTEHNHDPGLTYCDNGDLLAVWYTTRKESGRELAIAGARLRQGREAWDPADLFWDVADRNDHAPALWNDGNGVLYHFNGLGVADGWGELALVLRTSRDNGASWSPARLINRDHGYRNMPIGSVFATSDGRICLPCDAVPGAEGGSVLHISRDSGKTWIEPGAGKPVPKFAVGNTGHWIAGIHTAVAEATPGRLVAVGRGNNIDGFMPMSISDDGGKTWIYSATRFPPISGGQRAVLRRLQEGPLLLISFTPGSSFRDESGGEFHGSGMFAAVSDDGGKTWPVRKLLTDGHERMLQGHAWTGEFLMDSTHAEPKGYLTAVQTPDGVIHLISSGVHYRFNLAWLKALPASPTTAEFRK